MCTAKQSVREIKKKKRVPIWCFFGSWEKFISGLMISEQTSLATSSLRQLTDWLSATKLWAVYTQSPPAKELLL